MALSKLERTPIGLSYFLLHPNPQKQASRGGAVRPTALLCCILYLGQGSVSLFTGHAAARELLLLSSSQQC